MDTYTQRVCTEVHGLLQQVNNRQYCITIGSTYIPLATSGRERKASTRAGPGPGSLRQGSCNSGEQSDNDEGLHVDDVDWNGKCESKVQE